MGGGWVRRGWRNRAPASPNAQAAVQKDGAAERGAVVIHKPRIRQPEKCLHTIRAPKALVVRRHVCGELARSPELSPKLTVAFTHTPTKQHKKQRKKLNHGALQALQGLRPRTVMHGVNRKDQR